MDKCIIHFEQVTEEHLVELKDQASWETLLNAAKIRKFEHLIELDKNLGQSEVSPKMSFIVYVKKRSPKIKF